MERSESESDFKFGFSMLKIPCQWHRQHYCDFRLITCATDFQPKHHYTIYRKMNFIFWPFSFIFSLLQKHFFAKSSLTCSINILSLISLPLYHNLLSNVNWLPRNILSHWLIEMGWLRIIFFLWNFNDSVITLPVYLMTQKLILQLYTCGAWTVLPLC